jgi:hypothetical protein
VKNLDDDLAVPELDARPVDPRDTGWEVWDPRYRVYFWRPYGGGWASRSFEVSGADAYAVLDWATRHADDDETYTLFAVADHDDERGLVRLAGSDPTRTHRTYEECTTIEAVNEAR